MSEPIDLDAIKALEKKFRKGSIDDNLTYEVASKVRPLLSEAERLKRMVFDEIEEKNDVCGGYKKRIDWLETENARLGYQLTEARSLDELTACHNLGCNVIFHVDQKCPACHDEPRTAPTAANGPEVAHGDGAQADDAPETFEWQYALASDKVWIGEYDRMFYDFDEAREWAERNETRVWVRKLGEWSEVTE